MLSYTPKINEWNLKKITISFTLAPKERIFFDMYLIKFIRTTKLKYKIKEELNKWTDIACPEKGRLNIVKMLVLPTL